MSHSKPNPYLHVEDKNEEHFRIIFNRLVLFSLICDKIIRKTRNNHHPRPNNTELDSLKFEEVLSSILCYQRITMQFKHFFISGITKFFTRRFLKNNVISIAAKNKNLLSLWCESSCIFDWRSGLPYWFSIQKLFAHVTVPIISSYVIFTFTSNVDQFLYMTDILFIKANLTSISYQIFSLQKLIIKILRLIYIIFFIWMF